MTDATESRQELTKEQLAFLEECNLEFSERYTDADLEYKKIYDLGIPPPPIVYPYKQGGRRFPRDKAGGSRHNDYRNNRDDRQGSQPWNRGRRNFGRGNWNRYNERDGRWNQEQHDNVTRLNAQRPQYFRPY